MSKRIGIVDLGTNTFHVLIAETDRADHAFIYKEKIHVALGRGGISQGKITAEAQQRAIDAMFYIRGILDRFEVRTTRCVATSALRSAENADEVVHKLTEISGLEIEIISGNHEANYIFEGISFGLDLDTDNSLVMDIGGGSVEFIIGSSLGIFWKHSFEIGAQRLIDEFQKGDPITQSEIISINAFLENELISLKEALAEFKPKTLIGSSGTFDTLSAIYRKERDIHIIHKESEFPLTLDAIHSIHKEIVTKNRVERLNIPGMVEMRVDLIVVASLLIQCVLKMRQFEKVRVSSYSLKEGIFSEYLKTQKFLV